MDTLGEASLPQHHPVIVATAGHSQVVIGEDDVRVRRARVKSKPGHWEQQKGGRLLRRTHWAHAITHSWAGEERLVPFSCFHAGRRCPGPEGAVSEQTGGTSWELGLSAPRSRRRTHDRFSRGYPAQPALPAGWSGSAVASILEGASPFTWWLAEQYTRDIRGEGCAKMPV